MKISEVTLTDCLDNIIDYRGKTPKKLGSDWIDSGFRAISANNVKFDGLSKEDSIKCLDIETYKKWMKDEVEKGDLLLTSEAPAGQVMLWMSDEKIVLSQRLFALRTKKNVSNKYLKYYLQSTVGQNEINKNTSGSTVFGISAKMFDLIKVFLPDYGNQVKIGNLLYNIDLKIELNNRINGELEAMAKMFYDYWFVQFDFPDANGKPYKTSGGKMVWKKELKREIPEGWEVNKLGNILNTDLGGTPSTKIEKFWGGNIPWLNSGEIANFPIVESEAHITSEAISNSATTLMPTGTCVLSITRHLRPSILAIDACANQSVVGIFESDKFKSSFIYPYLKNEIPRLMTLRSGAQQPHINKGTVDNSLMIEPSELVLEKYYKKANPIYKQIISNSFQNQELASLRDWLLPMLMNGQVSVGDVEEELGMVAEESAYYKRS